MTFRAWRTMAVLGFVMLLLGCAGGAPKPISTDATLTAGDDVNPNAQGRPSPVMVRIFPLAADEAFRSAGIVNLQGDEPTILAGDLTGAVIARLVRPGQRLELDLEYGAETVFLGVVAEFIDPAAEWRAVVEVPEQGLLAKVRRPGLKVAVSADAIAATFE